MGIKIFNSYYQSVIAKQAYSFTLQVGANADDCLHLTPADVKYICPTTCPTVLIAGKAATTDWWGMGLRFLSVNIPKLATITESHLIVTCQKATNDACGTRISAELNASSVDFNTDQDIAGRWTTGKLTYVNWDFTPADSWLLDQEYNSPDISTVIQPVVNLSGWNRGNPLTLFWNDWDWRTVPSNNNRRTYPFNVSNSKAVKLFVKYIS